MKAHWMCCALALSLTGCVVTSPGPGSEPSDRAPQLINEEDSLVWDHPSRFGPVPPALQELGDATCRDLDFDHATGYHPEARNADGVTMSGGGFFCVHGEREDR